MTMRQRTQFVSMSTTVDTMIAATVAPASGTRSRMATSRPRAIANWLPTAKSTIVASVPATTLMSRLPVT